MVLAREDMVPWFVACSLVLAVVLHASRLATICVGLVVTMALMGVIQFHVWYDWRDGIFTSHWIYMTLLLRAGTEALRGDGYPIRLHPGLGLLAAILISFIAVHETLVTHLHAFHNYVHLTIYATGLILALSTSTEQAAAACFGASAAARVRSVRQFLDPSCLFAMGLLLIGHQHDPAPLSIALHTTFGYCLVALGGAIFACSLVHDVFPRASAVCAAMRRLHALGWILTGGITYTMCVAQYFTPKPTGGLKSALDALGIRAKTSFEEATTYVAATVLGSSVHLALLVLSSPRDPGDAPTPTHEGHALAATRAAKPSEESKGLLQI